jgi:hypothetical protein
MKFVVKRLVAGPLSILWVCLLSLSVGPRSVQAEPVSTPSDGASAETASGDEAKAPSPERASELFRAASDAFERSDFLNAAQLFEAAYRLAPHPSAAFNAAVAWDRAENRARAATAYENALTVPGLSDKQAEEARARLAVLREVLGYVRVDEPIGTVISIGHLEDVAIPVRLYVIPGTYRIRPAPNSGVLAAEVSVGAGEVSSVRLLREPPAQPANGTVRAPAQTSPTSANVGDDGAPSEGQETLGWVLLGGSVVASGVAIFLGVRALSAKDEYNQSGFTKATARSQAEDFRLGTNLAWAGAGALGLAGTALLLTSPTFEF